MKTDPQIHPIQAHILRYLTFHPRARYAKLNVLQVTTDQFTFHLKALLSAGLIQKTSDLYELTNKGKEFANRFDTDKVEIEKQAKISVLIGCIRTRHGKKEYLMQERLKQPYYGYYGVITGKIRAGETVLETAIRELKEETNLDAKQIKFIGIEHKMDYSPDGELLEDKYFLVSRIDNPTGTLTENFEGGRNLWLKLPDILKLPHLFSDLRTILPMLSQNKVSFTEARHTVSGF